MANQYRSILAGGAATGGDALPANVLAGKTFTNDNGPQTGTMVNRGAVSGSATPSTPYTIPEGYHNGEGVVTADGALNIQQFASPSALTGIPVTAGKHYVIFTAYYSSNDQTTITGATVITSYETRQDANTGYQTVFIIEATASTIDISVGGATLHLANTKIAQID